MLQLLKYFKGRVAIVLAIVALLAAQAVCDLALPKYTADIVDVGIQQSGVVDAVPGKMREATMQGILQDASGEDREVLARSYRHDGAFYVLTDQGRAEENALVQALAEPFAGSSSEDPLLSQQMNAAVKAEYAACGMDTAAIQRGYLLSVGARMMGVTLLGALCAVAISFLASRAGAGIARDLRNRLFEKVVGFSEAEIQGFSAASLITRATNDIQQIQMVSILLLRMVLYAPIMAVGGIVLALRTNVQMSWIIVLAVALVVGLVALLTFIAMPKFRIMQTLIDRVNLVAREVLTGLPVIRAFNRQKYEEERFDQASSELRRTQLFANRVMSFMFPGISLVMNGISVLIVWVASGYIDQGTVQTGDMIAFITYAMFVVMSFLMLSMVAVFMPRARVAASRIDEVLATEPSIADPRDPKDDLVGNGDGLRVEFRDVAFAYPDSPEPVLQGVSFTAEPGKTTAIIGATGSGKSTVLRLLMRSFDPTCGSVLVDGVDVRDLTQAKLHSVLGYVPQKAFLFTGTIAENLSYGNPGASREQLMAAARTAQAEDFVLGREEGLDSFVSQGGTDVSGGQRQRLAIARALACDARAFLFDDSFSALDYKTDAALRAALQKDLQGRTAIIVAQRISTIRNADNIVVFEGGRIVGQGTHERLMAECPVYREIAQSQLSESELEGGAC